MTILNKAVTRLIDHDCFCSPQGYLKTKVKEGRKTQQTQRNETEGTIFRTAFKHMVVSKYLFNKGVAILNQNGNQMLSTTAPVQVASRRHSTFLATCQSLADPSQDPSDPSGPY